MAPLNPTYIRFEERLKEVMGQSKRDLDFDFPVLKDLIRTEGGVLAAKRLLNPKERFTEGFRRLMENGGSAYTLESVVLEFADTGIFNEEEVQTAKWRLDNKSKANG